MPDPARAPDDAAATPTWSAGSEQWTSPMAAALGISLTGGGDGSATYTVDLTETHCNKGGTAHGGLLTMMLDMALGAGLVSTLDASTWCGTAQLSVSFLEAATAGSTLTATGRVVRRGRTLAHCAGEITDQRGRRIATATGTWVVWSKAPSALPGAT